MILAAEYTNGSKTRPAKLDIVEIVGGDDGLDLGGAAVRADVLQVELTASLNAVVAGADLSHWVSPVGRC